MMVDLDALPALFVEVVEDLLIDVLWELGLRFWTAVYWAEIISRIIVFASTSGLVFWVVRWILLNFPLDSMRESPSESDYCEQRAKPMTVHCASQTPSPSPKPPNTVTLPDDYKLFGWDPTRPRPKFWWVDNRPYGERLEEDRALLQRQMARPGYWYTPKSNTRLWLRLRLAERARNTLPEFPVLQEDQAHDSHESHVRTSPGITEMRAPPDESRPSTPLVTSTQTDPTTDVVSSSVESAEPPSQWCDAIPAADAGRAYKSIEVKQDIEPLQNVCAESTHVDPALAPVPVSTDNVIRPVSSGVMFKAPTWVPSSGVEYLPPRDPHPLFVSGEKPSSDVQYNLRGSHPLFAAPFMAPAVTPSPVASQVSEVQPASPSLMSAVCNPSIRTSNAATSSDRRPRPPRRNVRASERRKAALANATLESLPLAVTTAPTVGPTVTPTVIPTVPSTQVVPTVTPTVPSTQVATPIPSNPAEEIIPMAIQDWMRPLKEILALDIEQWGMSEEELMAWKVAPTALRVARLKEEAAETEARKDQYTLAARYGGIAVELKKTLVILRLQLKHSRQGFQPDYVNHDHIYKMILTASNAFTTLRDANGDKRKFLSANFSAFRNVLGFYLEQIADNKKFQDWVRQNRPEHGNDIIRVTKRRANFIRELTADYSARFAALLSQC